MKIKKEVRIVPSKAQSVCAETGRIIRVGESCLFDPSTRSVFHTSSKRFKDYTPPVDVLDQQEE